MNTILPTSRKAIVALLLAIAPTILNPSIAQNPDIASTFHFADGRVVKGPRVTVREGEPVGVRIYGAAEYLYFGEHLAAEFNLRPVRLLSGGLAFDMVNFILGNNSTPNPQRGRQITPLPNEGSGRGLNFLLGLGGSGPEMIGPFTYAEFILNNPTTKQWAGPGAIDGILPSGETRIRWGRDLSDVKQNAHNTYAGVVISTYAPDLILDVVDDGVPESITLKIDYIKLGSDDGRRVTDTSLSKFKPEQGEHVLAVVGSVVVNGTVPMNSNFEINLDGGEAAQSETTVAGNPIPNNAKNPTSVIVPCKAKFTGDTRLKHGDHTLSAVLTTPSGIFLARDIFRFNVPRPLPTVSLFKINKGAATTAIRQVTLNYDATGYPNKFMASESSSFAGATWMNLPDSPSFTLSAGNGRKTVWFKVSNPAGESGVMSDTIELNEPPPAPAPAPVPLKPSPTPKPETTKPRPAPKPAPKPVPAPAPKPGKPGKKK